MFFNIKYKENEEKYIKLFGNIKEKCYFCSRVEFFCKSRLEIRALPAPYIMKMCRKKLGKI